MLIFALLLNNHARHAELLTKQNHAIVDLQPRNTTEVFSIVPFHISSKPIQGIFSFNSNIKRYIKNDLICILFIWRLNGGLNEIRVNFRCPIDMFWFETRSLKLCRVLNYGIIIILNKNKYIVLHTLYVILTSILGNIRYFVVQNFLKE